MIDIKSISAGYGKKEILKKISISFEKGKLTSIIGPNGSGKSTLLKATLGIIPHVQGDILVDELRLSDLKRIDTAKHIAYLSQGRTTPDMTVEELVLHGRFPHLKYPRNYTAQDRDIAYSAMSRIGVEHLSKNHMYTLSGGMRQSVYVAMALAQNTDYILLDEPTTYLDVEHQLNLMKTLRSLADSGIGIVTVMHDLPLALSFSDCVAVLTNGQIAHLGSPTELCQANVIQKVFGIDLSYENGEYYYRLKDKIQQG